MKIYHCPQRSDEWHALRRRVFTASTFGAFLISGMVINMTVPEIKTELTRLEISYKGNAKREDLIALLPDVDSYKSLSSTMVEYVDEKIGELADGENTPPSYEDYWMRRGTALEDEALAAYTQETGIQVEQVGFILHDNGMIGCSPDGLLKGVPSIGGLEMKCPSGKIQMKRLREKVLPSEYLYQVHGCMVITEADFWDFWSYHPVLPPFHIRTERSEMTEKLAAGLKILCAEYDVQLRKLESYYASKFSQEEAA